MGHADVPKKTVDELLADFAAPRAEPGSMVFETMRATLDVRIAEMQRDAARDAVRWARLSAISTVAASLIALVALLVAAL